MLRSKTMLMVSAFAIALAGPISATFSAEAPLPPPRPPDLAPSATPSPAASPPSLKGPEKADQTCLTKLIASGAGAEAHGVLRMRGSGRARGVARAEPPGGLSPQRLRRPGERGGEDPRDPNPPGDRLTLIVVLRAFASGSTALTGVEAIANGVNAFKKPHGKNAAMTLAILGTIAIAMFLGVSWLAVQMHAAPRLKCCSCHSQIPKISVPATPTPITGSVTRTRRRR